MAPVRLIVVGAGQRGSTYARYALHSPDKLQIVAVADPNDHARSSLAAEHGIPTAHTYTDWRELAALPRFADGVIIATQDTQHADPAVALADLGYHLLLEKPMAPTPQECERITAAAERNRIILGVCHVMRYTRYTRMLKQILDSGRIGEIVSLQHLEALGFWHQAHSFVRGNWRNERLSSPMLLAKSCHDIDWIRYIVNKP
jgi:predicted dehydrogenase